MPVISMVWKAKLPLKQALLSKAGDVSFLVSLYFLIARLRATTHSLGEHLKTGH
jgi:hypothetical protein